MTTLLYRPPLFQFSIPQGQHFHLEFPPFIDTTTGELYDFVDAGCTARMDVVYPNDTPLVAFATSGEDGTITLGSQGDVSIDLDAAFTVNLAATTEHNGALQSPVYGDLVITDSEGQPWLVCKGTGEITRKVTDS